MLFYALTIFWSAFLLFLVQPILGKQILPRFGGTPAVWTTCLLFFQILLLGGYVYAHGLSAWLKPKAQAVVHFALLAGSLWFLPIAVDPSYRVKLEGSPTWQILSMLTLTVGAPYFLLSATGPLLQAWFAKTHSRSPYRLYALSNVGSLLALLSYPFVVEPNLKLGAQTGNWSWGYAIFAAVCGLCAIQLFLRGERGAAEPIDAPAKESVDEAPITRGTRFFWLALAATASSMLLATTNQICQEVAVVPFLWILPLVLYLLSFIICFDSPRWYVRPIFMVLLVTFATAAVVLMQFVVQASIELQIFVYSMAFFACAMVCHGELVRSKPPASQLTMFYLLIAAGGALGGLFVAVVAPVIFSGYWEYHLTLWGAWVLAIVALARDPNSVYRRPETRWVWIVSLLAVMALGSVLLYDVRSYREAAVATSRDFYGVLRISDQSPTTAGVARILRNGATTHGVQFLYGPLERVPVAYYDEKSGVSYAIRRHPLSVAAAKASEPPAEGLKVGVIGLGTGTIAAFGQPHGVVRFYEINPEVERISREYFTYRANSLADVQVVLGDARLVLEKELDSTGPQRFDVLAIDAFSSDAIPMHLLTRECNEIYWRHLKPDGILVIHVSNRNIDLIPVVHAMAQQAGKEAVVIRSEGEQTEEGNPGALAANWVLITSNQEFLRDEVVVERIREKGQVLTDEDPSVLWTDDYGSLWQVLRRPNADGR
jgi:spermidine synthase